MNILIPSSTEYNFSSFIRIKDLPNLMVVPYVRNRLNFAQLVDQALSREKVELILVDLPEIMGQERWIIHTIANLPHLITLYIKHKEDFFFYTYTPSDAAFLAMLWGKFHDVEYRCIDHPDVLRSPGRSFFPPVIKLGDDQFIFTEGLAEYFKKPWKLFEYFWWADQRINKFDSLRRASFIAHQLRELNSPDKKMLFVCEYRLWWLVEKILNRSFQYVDFQKDPSNTDDVMGILVYENPALLWVKGVLDDYPYLTYLFSEKIVDITNTYFLEKLYSLDHLLSDFFQELIKDAAYGVSPRRLTNFKRYLNHLLLLNKRRTPLPARHLFHAAEACFNNKIARRLANMLLSFPYFQFPPELDFNHFFRLDSRGITYINEKFDLPDILDTDPLFGDSFQDVGEEVHQETVNERKYWIDQLESYLTHSEEKLISMKASQGTWATSFDKRMRYETSVYLKNYFNKKANVFRTKISYGSLRDGIAWKATLSQYARGFHNIVVKEKKNISLKKWPDYCPMVFIFSKESSDDILRMVHEGNITHKLNLLGINVGPEQGYPEPDAIDTLFRSIRKMKYVLNNHVRVEILSAFAVTFTSRYLWIMRYNELVKQNPRYLCRLYFTEDEELNPFEHHAKIIAWTIKYAKDVVLILAYPGWKPSPQIVDYAKKNRVRLVHQPLSILPENNIRRLRINIYISNELKKNRQGEDIVKRYIRKMGFRI